MQRRDGSLTLYIQHEAREGGKGAKWFMQDSVMQTEQVIPIGSG